MSWRITWPRGFGPSDGNADWEWVDTAQRIEARRAGTAKTGPVHESRVAKPCAHKGGIDE